MHDPSHPERLWRCPQARLRVALFFMGLHGLALANDFPTLARVQYVQECQNAHPGPLFEMQSKCACALDQVAAKVSHVQFDTLKTATLALTIGGERGGALRDNPQVRPMIERLKAIEAQAAQACFLKRTP